MNTHITKGKSGWKAETEFELNDSQVLRISTHKQNALLVTTASVYKVEGGYTTFVMYQDFYQTVAYNKQRCTENQVRIQHQEVLSRIEDIKARAIGHYMKEAA